MSLVLVETRPDGAVRYTRYVGRRLTHAVEAPASHPLTAAELAGFSLAPEAFLAEHA